MSNEIHYNHITGTTLYFCAFQPDGNVFLSGGASDEVWGTGGRDADDYDEAMTEDGTGGHFVGTFDTSIAAGVYHVTVFLQAGANPADTDKPLGQGVIYWDGTAEINIFTIDSDIASLSSEGSKVLNELGPGE